MNNNMKSVCDIDSTMIKILKEKYRDYLLTPTGRNLLKQAVAMKIEWKQTTHPATTTTNGLNPLLIKKDVIKRLNKLPIIPIGLNNCCHNTSEYFCETVKDFDKKIGFNVTACPCGKMMSYELHSVNKYKNKLYDFTKDYNDENEKWFLEINTDICVRRYISWFGKDPMFINKGCDCPITWNKSDVYSKNLCNEEDIINHIEFIENSRIY